MHLGGDLSLLYRAKMRAAAPGVYKNARRCWVETLEAPFFLPPKLISQLLETLAPAKPRRRR
jgi:hypothetical protein